MVFPISHSQLLGVLLLSLWITSSSFDPPRPDDEANEYLRFAEVEHHCRSVLSSAAGLAVDARRASFVKRTLSFEKGDWHQAAGDAPLMPFDGGDVPSDTGGRALEPLSLATFVLTNVDGANGGQTTALNVSGVLFLSISRKNRDSDIWPRVPVGPVTSPEFKISPGDTKLRIMFEGVYTERARGSNVGDGADERVLCLIGRAILPSRGVDGADPWDWAKNSGRSGFAPPVTADDNVLLVLRYPKEPTLTNRAVLGEMRSTSVALAAGYFDPVRLVSRLWWYPIHLARSEELVSGACSPLPSIDANNDDVAGDRAIKRYRGSFFCEVLSRYGRDTVLAVPWSERRCDSAAATSCRSLGPFEMDRAADEGELAGAGIVMQDLQCDLEEAGVERLSAIFRVMPPWEDPYTAVRRSGLSGMTLSAEGVWNISAGQACMVACRGISDKACHFRVCLYMALTFSITRRSVLVGSITSINASAGWAAHSSFSFQLGLALPLYWGWDGERLAFTYNYSKVEQAGELLRRGQSPFDFRKIISMSLPLRYPKADYGNGDHTASLAYLTEELTLRFMDKPRMFLPEWMEQPVLHLEIIFLGQVSDRNVLKGVSKASRVASTGPAPEWQSSPINVYNPEDGRMYLIGCRDIRLPWRNFSVYRDLEEGMDCSIEVKVEYPPTSTHWFIWSTAKVHIASTRDAGDPLHFDTMKLQAIPTMYRRPRPDNVTRGIANGVLCIILLFAAIAAALSQLRHLRIDADAAPYVSLVMLGVQALGFGMPLVTDIQALRTKVTLRSDDINGLPTSSDVLNRMSPVYQSIYLVVKFLSLVAFVLTLCLGQNVRRSRARILARSRPELGRVPDDAKVLVPLALVVFQFLLVVNGPRAMTFEQHVVLMQDLFLLPQVIGNAAWRVNCKPLAGSYYLGVTAVRLLPHVYDYVRPPPRVAYSSPDYVNASWSVFFPNASDLVVPTVSVLLGLVVYVQQRWNSAIVGRMGVAEKKKSQEKMVASASIAWLSWLVRSNVSVDSETLVVTS
ncbi:hypothetical protein EJB05_11577, partial [Eragrostis curvula]